MPFFERVPYWPNICKFWHKSIRKIQQRTVKVLVYLQNELDEVEFTKRFDQRHPNGIFENIFTIVDGTECPIGRPKNSIQNVFYSGKKKRHTIKYEIGCRITDGFIVWVKGPYPGSQNDITMYRNYKMEESLLENEWVLADRGYQGAEKCVVPYKGKH